MAQNQPSYIFNSNTPDPNYLVNPLQTIFGSGATQGATNQSLSGYSTTTVFGSGFTSSGVSVTSFNVPIGVTPANTNYKIGISPSNILSTGNYFVNTKNLTGFTINYVSGITGTVAFDWFLIP